jgi:hypothetical protein
MEVCQKCWHWSVLYLVWKFASLFENSKEWRKHITCILLNQLYTFLHRIPSYKMSSDEHECSLIYSFELNPTVLPTDKFQLTEEHDKAQNNMLEMHSCLSHSSYTKKFNVKTYIVDSVEYNMRFLNSFEFSKRLANLSLSIRQFNANILNKLPWIKLNSNKIKTQHNNITN